MTNIANICDKIIAHLSRIGSPISSYLMPGISENDLGFIAESLSLVFPKSVMDMYKWRNGCALVDGTTFFPWYHFDEIGESVARYKDLIKSGRNIWQHHWFPLFSASDASSIGISCGSHAGKDGAIMSFAYTIGTRQIYTNLESMLNTILACYAEGIFFIGEDGTLDCNDRDYILLAIEHNPGIVYWKDELASL